MPVTCLMINCASRADRDHTFSYFRIPTVKKSVHYPHVNDLSRKRREMWLAAIKRDDLSESKIKNMRICSRHFISGKPSAFTDVDNPDWVPSQHLGHQCTVRSKRKNNVDETLRTEKKTKLSYEVWEPIEQIKEEIDLEIKEEIDLDVKEEVS